PGESISFTGNAGGVNILFGSPPNGLTSTGDQFWSQDTSGIGGGSEKDDVFGSALAAGDFNGDGPDDLAIGVPGEGVAVGGAPESMAAGAINILYGSSAGLATAGNELVSQETPGIVGT